jgi:hypothetical protein
VTYFEGEGQPARQKLHAFGELEDFSLSSYKPATGPYTTSVQTQPYIYTLFKSNFNIGFPPKLRPLGLPTEVYTRCKKVLPHPARPILYLKQILSLKLITLVIFNFVCNTVLVSTEKLLLSVSTLNVSLMLQDSYLTRGRGLLKLKIE